MYINSRTSLKAIKEMASDDFGIKLDSEDAKSIRTSVSNGTAVWTGEHYRSTSGIIRQMSRGGVKLNSGASYTRREWNS